MKERLIQLAYSVFEPIMRASPERSHGVFKLMMTFDVDGESKPLLVLGNAHSNIEDGQCIVVLNPNKGLTDELHGGCAYTDFVFKEIVARKCDEALYLWFDTYKLKDDQISVMSHYRSREPKPPKFEVR